MPDRFLQLIIYLYKFFLILQKKYIKNFVMGLILTDYDVAGGETRTSVVSAPSSADIQVKLGTVAGRVIYYPEKKQADGDWIPVRDYNGDPLGFSTLDEVENGMNIQGLGGSDFSIRVVPLGDATGTLSIDLI